MEGINLPPAQQMVCTEFMGPNNDKGLSKQVVIAPLRIYWVSDDAQKLSFGCSFWKVCYNEGCSFSHAELGKEKEGVF